MAGSSKRASPGMTAYSENLSLGEKTPGKYRPFLVIKLKRDVQNLWKDAFLPNGASKQKMAKINYSAWRDNSS
jgi:hypothetical protein